MDEETRLELEGILGYKFSDPSLLEVALTHASSVENRVLSNERLEFLGDSVLALVICESLYERFPNYLEGDLTKIKSMLVSRRTCARLAKQLGLHKYLKVSKGMANSRALHGSLAAAFIEAIIAVIYIDGGLDAATEFIDRVFSELIEQADANESQGNFKSVLQQYSQRHVNATPVYEMLDEKGPDHNKCFECQVVISDRYFESAWGTNKEAEQKAAFNALVELGVLEGEEG